MDIAAPAVTEQGGRTCHAAIVSRELGIPCVVGAGSASRTFVTGDLVTVSCAEGDEGRVYDSISVTPGAVPAVAKHLARGK